VRKSCEGEAAMERAWLKKFFNRTFSIRYSSQVNQPPFRKTKIKTPYQKKTKKQKKVDLPSPEVKPQE
jgi:hypothetical protein